MMTNEELVSYLLHAYSAAEPTALMASTSEPDAPLFIGIQGGMIDEKPAANILHSEHKLKNDMTLFLNYQPTEMELGLAWRANVSQNKLQNIFFIDQRDPLVIGQYKIDGNGYARHTQVELNEIPSLEQFNSSIKAEFERLGKTNTINIKNERTCSKDTAETLKRGLNIERSPIRDARTPRQINDDFMRIVVSLISEGWSDPSAPPSSRIAGNNIGAIMVDKDNKIIGWGLNLKSENKTFHAETLMIQRYLRENNTDKLPDGVKIYTSLQCCPMCAGYSHLKFK